MKTKRSIPLRFRNHPERPNVSHANSHIILLILSIIFVFFLLPGCDIDTTTEKTMSNNESSYIRAAEICQEEPETDSCIVSKFQEDNQATTYSSNNALQTNELFDTVGDLFTDAAEKVGEIADMTTEERNALRSANSYLSFMAFSYEGLVEQIEYENYPHETAVFAVDNCGADWNEQAVKSAQSYLDFSAFSYEGLIDQLVYEKFTEEQATYAADNCGADWYAQAAKCAESYLEFTSFSKEGLIDQLVFEGFTHDEAVYGAEQNGY